MKSQTLQRDGGSAAERIPMSKRTRRAVLAPVAVVLFLGTVTASTLTDTFVPVADVEVEPVIAERVPVAVALAQPAATAKVVQAPGWLEADPYLVACSALADGVVKEIHVLEGEAVEAGQLVATLVDDDARLELADAQANLRLAEAGLQSAASDLRAAQTDWDHPVEDNRMVGVYTARVAAKEHELEQLGSLINMESARLEGMQEELDRATEALQSGAATNTKIIVQQKAVDAQAAMLEATRLRRGVLESQLAEFRSELAAAARNAELRVGDRQRLDTARAEHLHAEASVQAARTEVEIAQLRLDRMTISAPIDGNVQRRLKKPGDKVMLGMDSEHSTHIVHIYDPAKLQVRVDVPLADAAVLSVGQLCEVVVDVLPDTTFHGEVTRITHEADLQKNTLQVKVRVNDPLPILKPEMLTRVKFLPGGQAGDTQSSSSSGAERGVYLVSPELISQTDAGVLHVNAVRSRKGQAGRIEIVPVERLGVADGMARVTGDLNATDLLAFSTDRLRNDQRVSISPRARSGGRP